MSINTHASNILKSLKGRLIGLDHRNFAVGIAGVRSSIETLSTAGAISPNCRTSVLATTAAAVYTLTTPSASMIGVRKTLISNSTVGIQYAKLTSGNFLVNRGTSFNTAQLSTNSAVVELEYISTALVAVLNKVSTAAGLTAFSTST